MKKSLLAVSLFSILFLAACTQATSIGIIGGADGPTAVYVRDDAGTAAAQIEQMPARMIRLAIRISIESDDEPASSSLDGRIDGTLENIADTFEIPSKDESCNFEGAAGYQIITDQTAAVLIGEDWITFEKIVEPEKDLLQYQFCYYVSGTMPNAERESTWLILAHEKGIDFTSAANSILSSRSSDHLDIYMIPQEN